MLGRDLNQRSPVKIFWRFNFSKIKKIGFRMCCCGKKTSAFMIFGRNLTILVVGIGDLRRRLYALNLLHFVGFLVVANGLAAGYSLIQGLRCVVSLVRGSVLFNKPLAWAIFSADQV
ncbi:CASP-like protein 2B1 [Arachis stenosperma]|uniref:CASP-like protein 2B1 n=1 Tax=Arachis stenosperma TaxID=217475 RepID=UPI0025AD017B|nr:CASP-like protein 2B1 [Arachis stenosperma]